MKEKIKSFFNLFRDIKTLKKEIESIKKTQIDQQNTNFDLSATLRELKLFFRENIFGSIKSENSNYTFKIENTSDEPKLVRLFGSYENLDLPNFGNDESVKIELIQSNYAHFLEKLKSNPLSLKTIRIYTGNESQFNSKIDIIEKGLSGTTSIIKIFPKNSMKVNQFQSNVIDVDLSDEIFKYLKAETYFEFEILPKNKINIVFQDNHFFNF